MVPEDCLCVQSEEIQLSPEGLRFRLTDRMVESVGL